MDAAAREYGRMLEVKVFSMKRVHATYIRHVLSKMTLPCSASFNFERPVSSTLAESLTLLLFHLQLFIITTTKPSKTQ